MRRCAELDLPATMAGPAAARWFIAAHLRAWGLARHAPDVQVMVCELVTNVVLHAGTAMRVGITAEQGVVEVSVADGDPHHPTLRPVRADLLADVDALPDLDPPADDTEGMRGSDPRHPSLNVGDGSPLAGRGLLVIGALAEAWGVGDRLDGEPGKRVWFRVRVSDG